MSGCGVERKGGIYGLLAVAKRCCLGELTKREIDRRKEIGIAPSGQSENRYTARKKDSPRHRDQRQLGKKTGP